MNKLSLIYEEFEQCPHKEKGDRFKELLHPTCAHCYKNTNDIWRVCDVHKTNERIKRFEKYGY